MYLNKAFVNTNNGDFMKRVGIITFLLLLVVSISFCILKVTYSMIISVTNINDNEEITDSITLSDLVTNQEGGYLKEYYSVKSKLNIDDEEAKIIIESEKLNDTLNIILHNVTDYRYFNKTKLSQREIIALIENAINDDVTINNELKDKVITKTKEYISDIEAYLYNIKTSTE